MSLTFEAALSQRVDAMLDACTRCGKCVEACPITEAAGVVGEPSEVIGGILDLVRTGHGPEASRKWASGCILSGECITACDEAVNPRFLLAMARTAMAKAANDKVAQRRQGVEDFRKVNREVTTLSRLQLTTEQLARLGQDRMADKSAGGELPDFVFYTGCNVLKTPHIALLCLDVMDKVGISYRVMGGPSHCCGVVQLRTGDVETSGRFGENTIDKLSQSKSGQVISWCPSCQVQFTETTLPTVEKMRGSRPLEMTPFMLFLRQHLDRLRPHLTGPVAMRVALHRHPGVPGVMAAAEAMLSAIPGVELIELHQPAVGLQSNSMKALPELRRDLQRQELDAAEAAGVDALVVVYHSDYRELCAHEREMPFRILNVLEVLAMSMGIKEETRYKDLKVMQDVDAILADCEDLISANSIDPTAAREAVAGMLAEQPAPLRSHA
jgi:Fe-S oxidoreductase